MLKIQLFCVSIILLSAQTEYLQNINNIKIEWSNLGVPKDGSGYHNNIGFLYSYGFGLSGYVNNSLRVSWQFSSKTIKDFRPGKIDDVNSNSPIWVVHENDTFGSDAYREWSNAVKHGAKYVDIDKSGDYDPHIDHPQKLGTETFYMLVNDKVAPEKKSFNQKPLNVEVGITGFSSLVGGSVNDAVFVEYTITNKSDTLIKDMIFSSLLDPDVGDNYQDDMVGCDTVFITQNDIVDNLAFVYNESSQDGFTAGFDLLRGPILKGLQHDSVVIFNGNLGTQTLQGFKDTKINALINHGECDYKFFWRYTNLRFVMEGKNAAGNLHDPTLYGDGGLSSDNPRIRYPGNPVESTGWRMNHSEDLRVYISSEPFDLKLGKSNSVLLAWFAANGKDNLDAITKLRSTDIDISKYYKSNYDKQIISNEAPSIKSISDYSIQNNEYFQHKLVFAGTPHPKLTLVDEPDGMIITKNGYINWIPQNLDLGEFKIGVTAKNSEGEVTETLVLNVTEPNLSQGKLESGDVDLTYGYFPYTRYSGDKSKLFGKYEIRWVADSNDYEHRTVVVDDDTVFHGNAYINSKTGKPVYAIHTTGSKKQLITTQFEVWHLGKDDTDPIDDVQIWVANGYPLGYLGGYNLWALLDHINYPESIYHLDDIAKVFTGIREDLEEYSDFFSVNGRPDWLLRYHFKDENYPDGAPDKVGNKSVISFDNPYIFPIDEQHILTETPFSYKVYASSDTVMSYSLTQKPEGMTIDSLGYIYWTPQTGNIGSHTIEIEVSTPVRTTIKRFNLNVLKKLETGSNSDFTSLGVSSNGNRLNIALYTTEQVNQVYGEITDQNLAKELESEPILNDKKSFLFNYDAEQEGSLKFRTEIEDIHENIAHESLDIYSTVIDHQETQSKINSELILTIENDHSRMKHFFLPQKEITKLMLVIIMEIH